MLKAIKSLVRAELMKLEMWLFISSEDKTYVVGVLQILLLVKENILHG